MQSETIALSETDLARIDPNLVSVRPGYAKNTTLTFTNGKGDPRWGNSTADGLTKPEWVSVNDGAKTCSGTSLIDLIILKDKSLTRSMVTAGGKFIAGGRPQPSYYRLLVVETIVHELMHVCQGWQIGGGFINFVKEERELSAIRQKEYDELYPNGLNGNALKSIFEVAAFNYDSRWIKAHAAEIHSGKFDFILPNTIIRGPSPGYGKKR